MGPIVGYSVSQDFLGKRIELRPELRGMTESFEPRREHPGHAVEFRIQLRLRLHAGERGQCAST